MQITGAIQKIDHKTAKNGNAYANITVDGRIYSDWGNSNLAVGTVVSLDAEQKGQYWNARNIKAADGSPSAAPPGAPDPGRGFPVQSSNEREERIVRQNATSTAAILVAGLLRQDEPKSWDLEKALSLTKLASRAIYEWNFNGYDAKTPEVPQELY